MKHSILSLAFGAILALGLGACNEDAVLPPVPDPVGGYESVGNGDWDNPISAYQAQLGYSSDNEEIWTYGYIVGWIDTDANATHTIAKESARFTAPGNTQTNILISMELPWKVERDADGNPLFNDNGTPKFILGENGKVQSAINDEDPDDYGDFWERCASVQLPSGDVRNKLNLGQNPANLGKLVSLKGTTGSKYCGAYGVRSVTMYNWGRKGIYEEPQDPIPPMPAVAEGVTFSKVSDITDEGQYLLVFDGNLMAGPVQPENYSYGYLPVSTVTPVGDNIVTSTLNSYYFYKVEGGYHIRDGYGRYVWWDSDPGHKSFQLTAKRGNEGMLWTVTPAANGTVEIKNVEMNMIIQYSSSFGNISAYSTVTGSLPVLYKRQ
ncbi:MAG: DUF6359 domain-containing protein [Muribaculum sp.]|nr:DUF6359 domain-containing protein [Muribaculum sp.]